MSGEPLRGTTWAVALLLVAAVAVGGAVSALVRYDLIGFGHLPRSALVALLLLVLLNVLAGRRRLFSSAQMLYVYAAVMVMSGFPGQQLVTYMYAPLVGLAHHASPANRWRELFFDYLPTWAVPSLSPEAPVVKWAFYGMPSGAALPWGEWVVPLAVWSGFMALLLGNYLCLGGLLRRQWVERERMQFPLAQIPVELARYRSGEAVPAVLRSWLFWGAFVVPVVIHSVNALNFHYPTAPRVNLTPTLGNAFSGRPWNELNWLGLNIYFDVAGVTYLLPAEVGFSLWGLWLLRALLRVARSALGRGNHEQCFQHMGLGSYLLLAVLTLGGARTSLRETAQEAWQALLRAAGSDGGPRTPLSPLGAAVARPRLHPVSAAAAEREPVPAPLAWWGFWGTLLGMVLVARAVGAAPGWALVVYLLHLLLSVVIARLVAGAGLYAVWAPGDGADVLLRQAVGVSALGERNLTALGLVAYRFRDTASLTLASVAQALKLGEAGGLRPRHLLAVIAAALGLGLVASHPASLYAIYSRGIPALGWWTSASGTLLGDRLAGALRTPETRLSWGNWGNLGLGAAVVTVLQLLHTRYLWWPVPPLTWAAAFSWIVADRYGFSFLLGWVLARLALKVGGYVAFRRFQPFVLGLIAGNGFALLVWTVIHYFHPISGALIIE